MNVCVPAVSVTDLDRVEQSLRRLFNTQDGQPCQYLLTSGYQLWLTQVKTALRKNMSTSADRIQMLETYLPNYHVYFVNNEVHIDFIRPCIPKADKRKRDTD